MLIDLYYIGLFFVALVCVYAIIYSRTTLWLHFSLYPQCLLPQVWTWQAMSPGHTAVHLPDEDVEVLYLLHN